MWCRLILDRIGSVKLTVLGFALNSVGYYGYLMADNLTQMWFIRLLTSAITPFYDVGMIVAIMELVSSENYDFAMCLYGLSEDIGELLDHPCLERYMTILASHTPHST